MTPRVREILEWYGSENPGVLNNLARVLNSGALAGTGRMLIFNGVDQLFSNPVEKFAGNPNSYDPNYHIQLAMDCGASAYIGSLGAIQVCAQKYAGEIPMILNLNSCENDKSVLLATTADALRLGCSAVALTIKAKKTLSADDFSQIQRVIASAQQVGLAVLVIIDGGSSIDELAAAVQASAQMGVHITVVKTPVIDFSSIEAKKMYQAQRVRTTKLYDRVKHIIDCSLGGKRVVLFDGDYKLSAEDLDKEVKEIARGGGFGSMVGLTALQRSKEDTVQLFDQLLNNYKSKQV